MQTISREKKKCISYVFHYICHVGAKEAHGREVQSCTY